MLRIGLTGGISSGKSTVCKWFKERGFLVIDADQIAHQFIRKGQICFKPIVRLFGKGILDSTGEIDRKSLGNLVFNDLACLKQLNELIHPQVTKKILQQLKDLEEIEPQPQVIVDASLMVESGFHKQFSNLIVVSCQLEQQVERLMKRSHLSISQARHRITLQMPLKEKLLYATFVIDNSGTLEQTHWQVEKIMNSICLRSQR